MEHKSHQQLWAQNYYLKEVGGQLKVLQLEMIIKIWEVTERNTAQKSLASCFSVDLKFSFCVMNWYCFCIVFSNVSVVESLPYRFSYRIFLLLKIWLACKITVLTTGWVGFLCSAAAQYISNLPSSDALQDRLGRPGGEWKRCALLGHRREPDEHWQW